MSKSKSAKNPTKSKRVRKAPAAKGAAKPRKPGGGRKPSDLEYRFNVRCRLTEKEAWEKYAKAYGYNGTGPYLRYVMNEQIKNHPHKSK